MKAPKSFYSPRSAFLIFVIKTKCRFSSEGPGVRIPFPRRLLLMLQFPLRTCNERVARISRVADERLLFWLLATL